MSKINYGWYRSKANGLYYRVFSCGIVLEIGGYGRSWSGLVQIGNKRNFFTGKTLKETKHRCEEYVKQCANQLLEEIDKW